MVKRKGESNVGKDKVTPIQVAFIVDRYLADNHYSDTRSAFRTEASPLLTKSSLQEAPKTLLSLDAMLDEYIRLKEHKLILDQEKSQLEQEKFRVHTLLQGMQNVMNAYNSTTATTTTTATTNATTNRLAPPPPPAIVPSSSAGYPVYRNPVMTSVSMTQHVVSSCPRRKRKNYKDLQEAPRVPKKSCAVLPNNQLSNKGSNSVVQLNNGSDVDHKSSSPHLDQGGSTVAKNLFNKVSQSPVSNSSGPKTPPRAASSQSDKPISPLDSTSPETTPTNCTIFSSKTIIVSPAKRVSIERRNHCSFSSPAKANFKRQTKRDCVKGRLDFDGSDMPMPTSLDNASGDGSTTSESEKEGDFFDLDLPNLDAFGPDFSLTELLTDFGIDFGELDYSFPETPRASNDLVPEPLCEANSGEHCSSVTEVFAGDMSENGADSITSVKSITKCIRILSPTKSSRNSNIHDQENMSSSSLLF